MFNFPLFFYVFYWFGKDARCYKAECDAQPLIVANNSQYFELCAAGPDGHVSYTQSEPGGSFSSTHVEQTLLKPNSTCLPPGESPELLWDLQTFAQKFENLLYWIINITFGI